MIRDPRPTIGWMSCVSDMPVGRASCAGWTTPGCRTYSVAEDVCVAFFIDDSRQIPEAAEKMVKASGVRERTVHEVVPVRVRIRLAEAEWMLRV